MIDRPKYLNLLIKNKNNGFPKIITGVRRCGKSYLLEDIFLKYLLSSGVSKNNILVIKLDDDENISLRDPIELGTFVRRWAENKNECYVILDEIQKVYPIVNPSLNNGKHIKATNKDEEIVGFVDVILGLSRVEGLDLYVTGSNSKMLSKDIVSEFRDKAVNINLYPLSFEEYFNSSGGNKREALNSYLFYGGMPLAVLKDNNEEKINYLINLFDTLYFKDIIEHNKLRKSESLDELCSVIASCSGQLINVNKIANTYKTNKKENIDSETVDSYINYFTDSFLINPVSRYDVRGRQIIGSLRKYYFIDNGLRNAKVGFNYTDKGQLLENLIYNSLIYNDYNVFVGTFDSLQRNENNKVIRQTYEIDFYAFKHNRFFYIQVCNSLDDFETKQREIKPYLLLNDQVQKIIVVNDDIEECREEHGFIVIGIIDFILRFIK